MNLVQFDRVLITDDGGAERLRPEACLSQAEGK